MVFVSQSLWAKPHGGAEQTSGCFAFLQTHLHKTKQLSLKRRLAWIPVLGW